LTTSLEGAATWARVASGPRYADLTIGQVFSSFLIVFAVATAATLLLNMIRHSQLELRFLLTARMIRALVAPHVARHSFVAKLVSQTSRKISDSAIGANELGVGL